MDVRCRDCGQIFKTPDELEDHVERVHHAAPKTDQPLESEPPNEVRP